MLRIGKKVSPIWIPYWTEDMSRREGDDFEKGEIDQQRLELANVIGVNTNLPLNSQTRIPWPHCRKASGERLASLPSDELSSRALVSL